MTKKNTGTAETRQSQKEVAVRLDCELAKKILLIADWRGESVADLLTPVLLPKIKEVLSRAVATMADPAKKDKFTRAVVPARPKKVIRLDRNVARMAKSIGDWRECTIEEVLWPFLEPFVNEQFMVCVGEMATFAASGESVVKSGK
jgi:hypothetical protein